MKGEEGAGPQTSYGTAKVLKVRKGEWHEINRDEKRGRTGAKDQLRYSQRPESKKGRVARDQSGCKEREDQGHIPVEVQQES